MNDNKLMKEIEKESLEDRRTLFDDAGEWSRHYSNVRMTVATFVITSCVAIIALTADGKLASPRVGDSVCALWLLGLIIFYAFTRLTFKERNRQLYHRQKLSVPATERRDSGKNGARIIWDAASWALFILNTGLAVIAWLPGRMVTSLPNDLLAYILSAVSVGSLLFILSADRFIGPK